MAVAEEVAVATEVDAVVEAADAQTLPTIPAEDHFIIVGHMVAKATAVQSVTIQLQTTNGEQPPRKR